MKTLLKILLRILGVFLMCVGLALMLAASLQTIVAFQTVPYLIIFICGVCLLNIELLTSKRRKINIYALLCFSLSVASFSVVGGAFPFGMLGFVLIVILVLSSTITGIIFIMKNKQKKWILQGKGLVATGIVLDIIIIFLLFLATFIYNPQYHYDQGVMYYSKGEYDRAIDEYNLAIKQEPQFFDAYYQRGLAYAAKGNYSQAIADYTKKIGAPSNEFFTTGKEYYARAVAYFKIQEYDKAWEDVIKAKSLGYNVDYTFINNIKKYLDVQN